MPCFYPLQAYQTPNGTILFSDRGDARPLKLPCGQCVGCRLERSRQWAMRCVHEASLHPDNCFITLTYRPDTLPKNASLQHSDFQKFMKRLRYYYDDKSIRFYMCGEYGETNLRPHYHAILFNHNFPDWVYLRQSPRGSDIYMSPTLEAIWKLGHVQIGTVTFESAAYIARYIMKKINGPLEETIDPDTGFKPYERIDDNGELVKVEKEYSSMGKSPPIGRDWIQKYTSDVYPKDFTTVRGVKVKPPRYYDRYLSDADPSLFDDIKAGRVIKSKEFADQHTEQMLEQKRIVKTAQLKQLKRSL